MLKRYCKNHTHDVFAIRCHLRVSLFQISFLANIIQTCIQHGRLLIASSPSHSQDIVTAALGKNRPNGEVQFAVLAGEIEKQSEAWGQLLLKLQQKNAGDVKDALSESVLAVQLMQSRLMKLSASAAVDCAGAKVAISSACSMMVKVGRTCVG